jgi:glycosyltransferase involved in cell wall biosynthesis
MESIPSRTSNDTTVDRLIKFSVVIPTCNRPYDLTSCLELLLPEVQRSDDYEIIVSDDGRGDSIEALIRSRFPEVIYTVGPGRGPAANRNHGASLASGQWLIFIDDDCLPDQGLIRHYSHLAAEISADIPVVYMGATIPTEPMDSLLWFVPNNPLGKDYISANFMMPRDCFVDVGRFDDRYPHAAFEDTEFFDRAMVLGCKIVPAPEAFVYHPPRRLGTASRMASKWEARVIYALDQGASPVSLLWRLPLHAAKVIQSRFRGRSVLSTDALRAAFLFASEFLHILCYTPCWVVKWSKAPKSSFWSRQRELGYVASGFGL